VYKRKLLWSTKGESSLARCIVVVVDNEDKEEEDRRNKTVSEKRIQSRAQKRKNAKTQTNTAKRIPQYHRYRHRRQQNSPKTSKEA
jgi:hypothetical protein